jgi:hypothetical protein
MNGTFTEHYADHVSLADVLRERYDGVLAIYEMPDLDPEASDRLVLPVIHRFSVSRPFGVPLYIICEIDSLYEKMLQRYIQFSDSPDLAGPGESDRQFFTLRRERKGNFNSFSAD